MKNVVVLGKFDGIHIGHKALLDHAAREAYERNMKVLVYVIGAPRADVITNDEDKKNILMLLGADEVRFRALDDELKHMTPSQFVSRIVACELDAGYVVVGNNFRFGKDRCADCYALRDECCKLAIDTGIVDTVKMDKIHGMNRLVSSTAIRELLSKGDVEAANKYLGRDFYIKGIVMQGKHLGRNIGFPTLNIYPPKENLIPKNGVYATVVKIDNKEYTAVTNVGLNPTVEDGDRIKIESHVFDFAGDCYGKEVIVNFKKFIRGEVCFDNVDALVSGISKDAEEAKKFFVQGKQIK